MTLQSRPNRENDPTVHSILYLCDLVMYRTVQCCYIELQAGLLVIMRNIIERKSDRQTNLSD